MTAMTPMTGTVLRLLTPPAPTRGPGRVAAPPRSGLLGTPVVLPVDRDHVDVPQGTEDLRAHVSRYGYRPRAIEAGGDDLIDILESSGLTGRGGAHFPVARKWRAVRATGRPATVIANGAESEPASAKDRALLMRRPHLVIDGLLCAAEAVGADELVIWTHHGDVSHRVLALAIEERRAMGWAEPRIRLASGPQHYLSGESSAIVQGLSGGPVLPQFRRVPAAITGVRGRPTLVQNVETLARVALAARGLGLDEAATTLLTVVADQRLTVIEADPTWTLADAVVTASALTMPHHVPPTPQAVLLGGYGGSWVSWDKAAHLPVHEATVRETGASLGAGVIAPLPVGACGLAETAAVTRYLADSSARQCGPCLFGLPAIARELEALSRGRASTSDLKRLKRHLGEVDGRGGCHHPDSAVRFVASALATFADDVHAHVHDKPCPRSAFRGLLPVPATASSEV